MQKGKLFAQGRAQQTSPSLSVRLQGGQCQQMEEAFFGMGAPRASLPLHGSDLVLLSLWECGAQPLPASPERKVLQNLMRSLFGAQAGLHSCSAWGELGHFPLVK